MSRQKLTRVERVRSPILEEKWAERARREERVLAAIRAADAQELGRINEAVRIEFRRRFGTYSG